MTTSAETKARPAAIDYYEVMRDLMHVALTREEMYDVLVRHGHRRRDLKEERLIASLKVGAGLAELAWLRETRR